MMIIKCGSPNSGRTFRTTY